MYKEAYAEIEKATILASEGNVNVNAQNYVFDMLNDMSMALIINNDYKYLLEQQQSNVLTYDGGKMSATEDLDKQILKNLKKCEAKEFIGEDE